MSMIEMQIKRLQALKEAMLVDKELGRVKCSGSFLENRVKIIDDVIETIQLLSEKLHSQNIHGGWIPCEERLPDPQKMGDADFSDDVQVCMSNNMVTDAWYCFSDEKWYKQGNGVLIGKVIAWMPLPKPYKEQL